MSLCSVTLLSVPEFLFCIIPMCRGCITHVHSVWGWTIGWYCMANWQYIVLANDHFCSIWNVLLLQHRP